MACNNLSKLAYAAENGDMRFGQTKRSSSKYFSAFQAMYVQVTRNKFNCIRKGDKWGVHYGEFQSIAAVESYGRSGRLRRVPVWPCIISFDI